MTQLMSDKWLWSYDHMKILDSCGAEKFSAFRLQLIKCQNCYNSEQDVESQGIVDFFKAKHGVWISYIEPAFLST